MLSIQLYAIKKEKKGTENGGWRKLSHQELTNS